MRNIINIIEHSDDGLYESPTQIGATDFDLENVETNKDLANQVLRKISEMIEETPDYIWARTGDLQNGWIFLFNKHTRRIEHCVKYAKRKWGWMPSTVTQVLVWNDPAGALSKDQTKKVFFEYLLPHFGTILSDGLQTDKGNRFWIRAMREAIDRGLKVGILNLNKHKIEFIEPNDDLRTWLNQFNHFSPDERLQTVRYLISQ